jgi:signal transduction histidine kinase
VAKPDHPTEPLDGLGAAVLDALPIGLYVVDRRLHVVAWNRLREQGPIGKPSRRAVGQPLSRLLTPAGFKAVAPVLEEIFRTGEAREEFVETRERLYHVRRLPVKRAAKVTHVLSWFEDVTERRSLEMRLIASDRLAYLGQLVAGVAHEISNPLAGIAGCAEALSTLTSRNTGKDAKEARRFRDLIRTEVARCERIVRFLLDSARPSPGGTADVGEIVSVALRLLDRHPAFHRVKVRSQIPGKLPAARIEADSLKQVVLALATNAAQAMPTGGTLTLKAGRDGRNLVLDVIDTGPGIAESVRPRLFEPYFTTDPQRGAGLGLPVARSLLKSQGGDLLYRARKNGSCFRVVLKTAGGRA